jgi:hypothetical protein
MYLLKFHLRGTNDLPLIKKGRFKVMNYDYTNTTFVFSTKAKPEEKLIDIIKELNQSTQSNPYNNEGSEIYLDNVIFNDNILIVKELSKFYKELNLKTYMYNTTEFGKICILKIQHSN